MSITAFESFGDDGVVGIRDITGRIVVTDDADKLLEFLRFTGKHTHRLVFNVDEFAAPILRKLPTPVLEKLVSGCGVEYGRYHLFYRPNTMFQVGHTRYYSIQGFLNLVGILTAPPLEQVQETGEQILDAIAGMGLGEPKKLSTAGAMFASSDVGQQMFNDLPKLYDANISGLVSSSVLADHKYWVTAYRVGSWVGNIFDYDQTACFASQASRLFDIRDLTFRRSSKVERNAIYGVAQGRFYIDPRKSHLSPIMAPVGNGMGNPGGLLDEDTYTLEEIRVVERYGIGEFTPSGDGIYASVMGGVRPRQPFQRIMDWLYEKRVLSDMSALVSKVASNAIIGKLVERDRADGTPGEYKNQFYHSQITAGARCEITKFLCNNDVQPDEIVSVQTDGVRLLRDIPCRNGRMGAWRNNGSEPTIVVSGHKVYVGDKRPYKITYEDVVRMITEHPYIERYCKKEPHRTTLMEAVDAGDIGGVGGVENAPTYFDMVRLPREQTRLFNRLPKNGSELLNNEYGSEPIILGATK